MNLNYINYIFTAFIVVMCLALSYFAMFTDLLHKMSKDQRLVLTIVLLAYAGYRVYRTVRSIRKERSERD